MKYVWLSIEWRVIATLLTFALAWLLTKELALTLGIVGIDVVAKTFGHAVWLRARKQTVAPTKTK